MEHVVSRGIAGISTKQNLLPSRQGAQGRALDVDLAVMTSRHGVVVIGRVVPARPAVVLLRQFEFECVAVTTQQAIGQPFDAIEGLLLGRDRAQDGRCQKHCTEEPNHGEQSRIFCCLNHSL